MYTLYILKLYLPLQIREGKFQPFRIMLFSFVLITVDIEQRCALKTLRSAVDQHKGNCFLLCMLRIKAYRTQLFVLSITLSFLFTKYTFYVFSDKFEELIKEKFVIDFSEYFYNDDNTLFHVHVSY